MKTSNEKLVQNNTKYEHHKSAKVTARMPKRSQYIDWRMFSNIVSINKQPSAFTELFRLWKGDLLNVIYYLQEQDVTGDDDRRVVKALCIDVFSCTCNSLKVDISW